MFDEEIQVAILEFLYGFWLEHPFQSVYLERMIEDGLIEATEAELHRNAQYLASKGLISVPRTVARFGTSITSHGIDFIETKKLSRDFDIRKKLLAMLKDAFDENPHKYVREENLFKKTGFSEVEMLRNMKYLDDAGRVEVRGAMGVHFRARITALGIDYLKGMHVEYSLDEASVATIR